MHLTTGASQKSGRVESVPAAPEFVALLNEVPSTERTGRVFKGILAREDSDINEGARVSKIITAIGRAAGVCTSEDKGKWASAHDLRRSFCTRWAMRVMPAVLCRLVRHKSINTTLAFYIGQSADAISDTVWAAANLSDKPSDTRQKPESPTPARKRKNSREK